jgi:hypothetical protein
MSQPFTQLRSVVDDASSGMDASVTKYLETLDRTKSSEFLRGSHHKAAIMVPSLAGVRTIGGRPASARPAAVTLPVS